MENTSAGNLDLEISQDDNVIAIQYGCCNMNGFVSKQGQRFNLIKLLTLVTIPAIALIVLTAMNVHDKKSLLNSKSLTKSDTLFSLETGKVVHFGQIERGTSVLYLSSKADSKVYEKLTKAYRNTDDAIDSLSNWYSLTVPSYFKNSKSFKENIETFRSNFNPGNTTVREVLKFYTDDITVIIDWVVGILKRASEHNTVWLELASYYNFLLAKEQHGLERALGGMFFNNGGFSTKDHLWFVEKKLLSESYLAKSQQYSNRVKEILDGYLSGTTLVEELDKLREIIIENNSSSVNTTVQDGVHWFDKMTEYIDILKNTQDTLGGEIVAVLDSEIEALRNDHVISITILVSVLIVLPIIIVIVYRQTDKLQLYARNLHQKTGELEIERKRTETLLYQMLPVSVARKLMANSTVFPQEYPSASIFFSDIVGFTSICSHLKPLEVINMLNMLYKTFDDRLELYDVYKVETIGDAYMVVSGVPQANDKHVVEISNLSLNVLDVIPRLVIPMLTETLQVRIGINTGPVVAGVVGNKMPRYCLFGDTVNVASRMESTGKPQKVQISSSTYECLLKYPEFVTERRGEVSIKGKGMMITHWLLYSTKPISSNHLERLPPL